MPFEYYPHASYGSEKSRRRWATVERRYVPRLSGIIALGDKMAEDYQRLYGMEGRVHFVYSSRPTQEELPRSVLRARLGLSNREKIIFYAGYIRVRRGLMQVVEAMRLLPPDCIFVIMGYGQDAGAIAERAAELGLADRVRIVAPVPQTDVVAHAAGADVGVIPILNTCRSYYLCNPGKLFECIAAGLPLAVSNLAQLEWYVTTRGLGEVFDPACPQDVARALKRLLEDDAYRGSCAARARDIQRTEAGWEIQAEKLRRIVLGAEA